MAISINGGIQKWMVYFMENPIKMDDLEVLLFQETTIYICIYIVYIYIEIRCAPVKQFCYPEVNLDYHKRRVWESNLTLR